MKCYRTVRRFSEGRRLRPSSAGVEQEQAHQRQGARRRDLDRRHARGVVGHAGGGRRRDPRRRPKVRLLLSWSGVMFHSPSTLLGESTGRAKKSCKRSIATCAHHKYRSVHHRRVFLKHTRCFLPRWIIVRSFKQISVRSFTAHPLHPFDANRMILNNNSYISAISEVVLNPEQTCEGRAMNSMGEARLDIIDSEINRESRSCI